MAKSKYQLTRRKTNVAGRFVCLDNTSGDIVIWFLVGSTVLGCIWVKIGKTNCHAWPSRSYVMGLMAHPP